MKNKKKILVMRLGAIGDVVFTTIIAAAIKSKYPQHEIHYLVLDDIAPILGNHPYIDRVLIWERSSQKSFKYLMKLCLKLNKEKYDIVFNLNNTLKSLILSSFAMPQKLVPKKIYGGLWVDDFFLVAQSVFPEIDKPKTLSLGINEEKNKAINEFLSNYPKPYIFIAPGGETNKNRAGRVWNIEYWNTLCSKLLENFGGTIFVCGSPGEQDYHKSLEQNGVKILSGKYTLEESGALISHADLFISGDTGPLHIASAHNVKTLALLGSTSPDKIKPYGENGHWVSAKSACKYCWNKTCKYLEPDKIYTPCMENLTPQEVYNEIVKLNLLT